MAWLFKGSRFSKPYVQMKLKYSKKGTNETPVCLNNEKEEWVLDTITN